ncbi:interferon alpha-inducible protein 27-like protein 2B isoform X1 [Magallana gigas]|uniref:interferon alpha-inducible protein 27-like protein 2B isoform X1 n=1 Tax=Magallana gigas TaxID=29159 RepID=UPI00333E6197
MASVSAVNCVFLVCLCMGLVSYADSKCPKNPDHGYWDEDTEKDRCILRCNGGFEPSGCHVIRYNYWKEKWNHDVPKCQEEWPVSGKTLMVVGTGVAAVVATPVLLAGAGFTAAGVAAGSIAAMLQTPFTAAGGWFALSQSAGVIGTAATTKGAIGAVTGAITYATSSAFSNCEEE